MKKFIFLLLALFTAKLLASPLLVAITFDDLPEHGNLPAGVTRLDVAKQMLAALDKHSIKNVYGFINASPTKNNNENYDVLKLWVSSGQLLGNHTYNHINLDKASSTNFIQQIQKNELYLAELMQDKNFRFFRYPYLHEGNTQEKRDTVRDYLQTHNYQIAQVTMDFSDYLWNNPYARCLKKDDAQSIEWLKQSYINEALNTINLTHELSMLLFQRDIKNILLLHFGAFDSLMLNDLITAFEKHGVKFISLDEALQDQVYRINPNIVREETDIFTAQLLHAKKLSVSHHLAQLLASVPEKKLKRLCK